MRYIQSKLTALTLNTIGEMADKEFAYCSIEAKSQMFNVFFELGGKIKTLNEIGMTIPCYGTFKGGNKRTRQD